MKFTQNTPTEKTKAEVARDLLLDADDSSRITLADGAKKLIFDQVYTTVVDGVLYCILCPVSRITGLAENSALVFRLDADGALRPVRDEATCSLIFAEYYELLREAEDTDDEESA